MKRAGKCVGKKPFNTRRKAKAKVVLNYVRKQKTYGIYQCPTCLDFHTTSKYDNRDAELKKLCRETRNTYYVKVNIIGGEKANKWLEKKILNLSKEPKPVKVVKKTPPNPNSKTQLEKKKKREYKASIIPLAEQRRLLQLFDGKTYPQPIHLQGVERGIIVCTAKHCTPYWIRLVVRKIINAYKKHKHENNNICSSCGYCYGSGGSELR